MQGSVLEAARLAIVEAVTRVVLVSRNAASVVRVASALQFQRVRALGFLLLDPRPAAVIEEEDDAASSDVFGVDEQLPRVLCEEALDDVARDPCQAGVPRASRDLVLVLAQALLEHAQHLAQDGPVALVDLDEQHLGLLRARTAKSSDGSGGGGHVLTECSSASWTTLSDSACRSA